MNVVITSASRKVSLIKAFKKAVSQVNGNVIAMDTSPLSPSFYFSDQAYVVPPSNYESFLPLVLNFCREHKVKLVVPTRDEELLLFAENVDEFKRVGTTVMVSSPAAIKVCQDKKQFIDFCGKNGYETPEVIANPAAVTAEDFPLFVRSRYSKASESAYKVKSQEELSYHTQRLDEPIIQEYVDAEEYTVDLFADFDGTVLSVVPRQRITVFGGESFVGKTFRHNGIINASVRLAESLGLIGHNTIQCFLDDDEAVKFVEVNPRYGGGVSLSFAAGAPTPSWLIQLINGEKLKPVIGDFTDRCLMLRYTDDIYVDLDHLKGDSI
jgi:carbamoyl-phosphate synthase large subunit